jgi:CheY-like chemotaxis protein
VAAPVEAPRVQLPALRLLVADDVAQNLELLQLLLGREGHEVVAVSDGLQAVQAFSQPGRAGRFDAVLMDVHMPTLDGLGATRRIRVFEQTQGRLRTPIVALTASVLEEDRQAALAAGMDGFAVKPVEPERLFQELARVLGLRPAQTPVPPPAADAVRADALAVIDATQGLRLWSQSSAWRRALRRFAEEQAEGVPRLQSLLQAGEWLEARGLAHRWRGVAGTLALPRLQQRAQLLEDALRLGRLDVLPALGAQLGDALDEVLAAIAELGAETRPAPLGAPAEGAVLTAALKQLEQALQHGELADAVLQTLQQQLPAERCAPLLRALDQFDFEAALAAVAELRTSLRNT